MQIMYLAALNKQKTDIAKNISLIAQRIVDLKKLLDSNNVYAVSAYKSKFDSFRKLPPYFRAKFPCFSSNKINTEYLQQQFGRFSAFSIESQEYDFKMESSEAASPSLNIRQGPILDQPKVITTIDTDFEHLFSVTCLTDEQIWTRGDSNIIKLYNL